MPLVVAAGRRFVQRDQGVRGTQSAGCLRCRISAVQMPFEMVLRNADKPGRFADREGESFGFDPGGVGPSGVTRSSPRPRAGSGGRVMTARLSGLLPAETQTATKPGSFTLRSGPMAKKNLSQEAKKQSDSKGPLAAARNTVSDAAGMAKEHVVEPVPVVKKPKKSRFVREKKEKKPRTMAIPLPPRSTKAAGKMMSKNVRIAPRKEPGNWAQAWLHQVGTPGIGPPAKSGSMSPSVLP